MSNPLHEPQHKHLLDEDVISATTDRQPSIVRDKRQAQMVLRECSGDSGQNVYDHMSAMIRRILDERPPDVIDYFEDFSRQVRDARLQKMHENVHQLRSTFIESARLEYTRSIMPMLKIPPPEDFPGVTTRNETEGDEEGDEEGGFDPPITDLEHLQFYWGLAGYGFPPGQVYILSCCLRQFRLTHPKVTSARFWGQLYGIEKNYYVIEADLSVEEIDARVLKELQFVEDAKHEFDVRIAKLTTDYETLAALPKLQPKRPVPPEYPDPLEYPRMKRDVPKTAKLPASLYRPQRDIPAEVSGTGLNRKTYFVCNQLTDTWVELPPVTPQQIQVSRKIRKFLTGNLETALWSYPIFPGVEKNYLRAMIARITAATYVAPVGYYRVGGGDEEEEVDEEDHNNDKITSVDPGYEPISAKELLLPQSWQHYRPNILVQGRVNWFNPKDLEDKDEEEEEAEEEEEDEEGGKDEEKEEMGPGVLTPCSEDVCKWGCWLIRMAQTYNPSQSMVVINSNLWPGAFSFAQMRTHDSIYVGWGLKRIGRNYSPVTIPNIQSEYVIGPEVMEILDPSVEEEDGWRAAHEKHVFIDEEGDEEGDMEGEDEQNDNDDDEDDD